MLKRTPPPHPPCVLLACIASVLVGSKAGMLAVLVLAARSRRRPPRNPASASASARASEHPAEKVAAKDDVDDVSGNDVADPTPSEIQQQQEAEKEEGEAIKVDGEAEKEDDPVGAHETEHVEGTKDDEAEEGADEEPVCVVCAGGVVYVCVRIFVWHVSSRYMSAGFWNARVSSTVRLQSCNSAPFHSPFLNHLQYSH